MDQTTTGNFIAYMNRNKEPGDNKPTFDGKLSVPGAEGEQTFALWAHEYKDSKTGELRIMFNGRADAVSPTDEPISQVVSLMTSGTDEKVMIGNLSLSQRQLVLFPNRFKEEAPEKDRPDYWGAFNPGNGQPIVRISAWMRKDRYKNAVVSGATSYPLPGKSELEQQSLGPTLADLQREGVVTQGMPANPKKRAGR